MADALVRWDKDGTENIVSTKELKVVGGGRLRVNSRVRMWWTPNGKLYSGYVISTAKNDDGDVDITTGSDDDDDIPLAQLCVVNDCPMDMDDSLLAAAAETLNSSSFLREHLNDSKNQDISDIESQSVISLHDVLSNEEAITHAKNLAITITHAQTDDDTADDPDFLPDQRSKIVSSTPESYEVEGVERHVLNSNIVNNVSTCTKRQLVKEVRLRGTSYVSEKSNRVFGDRSTVKPRCNSRYCSKKGYGCEVVPEERRAEIIKAFHNLPSLQEQRNWLARHISTSTPKTNKENSRKSRNIDYYLPIDDNGDAVSVCRPMFLNTLRVTDRQVRVVLKKTDATGILQQEMRGGRPKKQAARDTNITKLVDAHIKRFPKVESHYCRAESSFQYLSADLTITKMHQMYNDEHENDECVTLSFYYKRMKKMKLKFHRPKKDLCGLCETYRQSDSAENERFEEEYCKHTSEKNQIRKIKRDLKERNVEDELIACFDLQQVILLPRSNRGELFYKCRLSCYNFTIFDSKAHKAHCFLWNEAVAKRGANEMSSHLCKYLNFVDCEKYQKVHLFCDGCPGQNKNTIVCSMIMDTISKAVNLKEITILYFETGHGQCEGDAVHSVIERSMKNVGEIYVPAQLSTLVRLSASSPYIVHDVVTSDIKDYKSLSVQMGLLRCRVAEDGEEIQWTNIRQLQVTKDAPNSFFFKLSHHQDAFSEMRLPQKRNVSSLEISPLYTTGPQITSEKYADIMTLCTGPRPVIRNPEHVNFFKSLPH